MLMEEISYDKYKKIVKEQTSPENIRMDLIPIFGNYVDETLKDFISDDTILKESLNKGLRNGCITEWLKVLSTNPKAKELKSTKVVIKQEITRLEALVLRSFGNVVISTTNREKEFVEYSKQIGVDPSGELSASIIESVEDEINKDIVSDEEIFTYCREIYSNWLSDYHTLKDFQQAIENEEDMEINSMDELYDCYIAAKTNEKFFAQTEKFFIEFDQEQTKKTNIETKYYYYHEISLTQYWKDTMLYFDYDYDHEALKEDYGKIKADQIGELDDISHLLPSEVYFVENHEVSKNKRGNKKVKNWIEFIIPISDVNKFKANQKNWLNGDLRAKPFRTIDYFLYRLRKLRIYSDNADSVYHLKTKELITDQFNLPMFFVYDDFDEVICEDCPDYYKCEALYKLENECNCCEQCGYVDENSDLSEVCEEFLNYKKIVEDNADWFRDKHKKKK